jgi:uncharacterized membrane protein
MIPLSMLDIVAVVWFCGAWIAYTVIVEWTAYGATGLNAHANRYRYAWMQQMLRRDTRIADTQIMASLQSGTAFFASSSLVAIGGALAILRANSEILDTLAALPLGTPSTPRQWEAKVIGLVAIFAYAFFTFSWSYRLFNYAAIMLGAAPPREEMETPQAQDHANRTARLSEEAGRHFNRGQRGLFFALAYLGWFVSGWLLMILTTAVIGIQWRRHFASDSIRVMTR